MVKKSKNRRQRHTGESRIGSGTGAGIQKYQLVTNHWTPAFAAVTTAFYEFVKWKEVFWGEGAVWQQARDRSSGEFLST
jgi:hypothetical protein